MKRYLYLAALLLFSYSINAQTEEELIKEALINYMDGTSYNQIDRIEKAFYPGAELFLDNKDNSLRVVPIATYIGYFEKSEPGKFNGRISKLLSIEHFGNIAMAKVEILMPHREARYIDMFILKKVEGAWKIISKTANSEKSNKKGERILFAVSNADHYGDSDISTGNSFSEIVEAYDAFDQEGFTIDFVSPEGGAIPLAYINTADSLQKKYVYQNDFMYALSHTARPDEIEAKKYSAIYFPGGGSAMFGVPENEAIQKIAMKIYEEQGGVIGSVCHGTAGIVNLKTKDGQYLVKGKTINGYPDDYERQEAEYFKEFPFLIKKTVEARGGNFKFAPRNTPNVEAEDNVITGQNHYSTKLVAAKIIETLKAKK